MKKTSLIILSLLLLISGCAQKENNIQYDNLVVTTIPPLYSLTQNLVKGLDIHVENIVPDNTSVHHFSLKPKDAKLLADSDLIIINGLGLETFLENTINEYPNKVSNTSQNINKLESKNDSHDEDGIYDPHVWLSPLNAIRQTEVIKQSLIKKYPEYKEKIVENRNNLINRLNKLDKKIDTVLKNDLLPYIVFHKAYSYLEDRYYIKPKAYLQKVPDDYPSSKELKEIIDIVQENKIKVIFTEPQFNPKIVKTLSEDYDLTVLSLDPLGKSTENGYFDMMEYNLKNLSYLIK